jgi:5'-nucleotidase
MFLLQLKKPTSFQPRQSIISTIFQLYFNFIPVHQKHEEIVYLYKKYIEIMKRILVDMDGVLVDNYPRFFELYEKETGLKKTMDEVAGLLEGEAFPGLNQWVQTPGFFRTMPVMPDSQRVLKSLNEIYEIIVVSMATEFPVGLTDKQFWLNDNFPFISWKQIVFCGDKSIISADLMIDDHFKNLDKFKGETIMFRQPHNMNNIDHKHKIVHSWKEIEKLLLP